MVLACHAQVAGEQLKLRVYFNVRMIIRDDQVTFGSFELQLLSVMSDYLQANVVKEHHRAGAPGVYGDEVPGGE